MPCTLSVLVTGLTCRRVLCHNMLLRAACGDGVLLVALLSRCVCVRLDATAYSTIYTQSIN